MDLQGKVALVTGSSQGIGQTIALELANTNLDYESIASKFFNIFCTLPRR